MFPRTRFVLLAAGMLLATTAASAQDSTADEIAKYREMMVDDNPADLWELRGAELWRTPAGPKKASLEKCDLGLGPGVVKGAYARLPRYFADTRKVQDLESRLISCRMTLQGLSLEEATRNHFAKGDNKSEIEALVSWISAESRGEKVQVSTAHPKEKEAYEIGRQIFYHRSGPYDFSCGTCHSQTGKRIRLQDLPNLASAEGAGFAATTWPAYRVSQGEVRTMQHRMYDCFRQQRFPEVKYGSDAVTALIMFMAVNGNGTEMVSPTMKR